MKVDAVVANLAMLAVDTVVAVAVGVVAAVEDVAGVVVAVVVDVAVGDIAGVVAVVPVVVVVGVPILDGYLVMVFDLVLQFLDCTVFGLISSAYH